MGSWYVSWKADATCASQKAGMWGGSEASCVAGLRQVKAAVVLVKHTNLEGNFVEVAIKCSQYSLMSNNTYTLALSLNLNDDWLQPLNDIKVALPTWVPANGE